MSKAQNRSGVKQIRDGRFDAVYPLIKKLEDGCVEEPPDIEEDMKEILLCNTTILGRLLPPEEPEDLPVVEGWKCFKLLSDVDLHHVGKKPFAAESWQRLYVEHRDLFPKPSSFTHPLDITLIPEDELRGVAALLFYDGKYEDCIGLLSRLQKDEIDSKLMLLEAKLCRGGDKAELQKIWEESKDFDKLLKRDKGEISKWQILIWANALRAGRRPFGAILLCRALSITFPENDISINNLRLSYSLFAEIALIATTLLDRGIEVFTFVLRSLAVVYRQVEALKVEESCRKEQIMIKGNCCNLLSFLCSIVGLYGAAERWAKTGSLGIVESRIEDYTRAYPDSLVNRGLVMILRGEMENAKNRFIRAKLFYNTSRDFREPKHVTLHRVKVLQNLEGDLPFLQDGDEPTSKTPSRR